jgi:hypothetical protein
LGRLALDHALTVREHLERATVPPMARRWDLAALVMEGLVRVAD